MATFLTLQQEVAARLRLDLTQAPQQTLVQRWLNRAQKEIWESENWNFALDRQIFQTVVDATAGTVSVSQTAVAVTGVGTAFTSTMVGYYIQFAGTGSTNDWYKIATYVSATSITIESGYTGTQNLAAGTYIIRKFYYSMGSTVEQIISARQAITPKILSMIDSKDFDVLTAYPSATGTPNTIVLFGVDASNNLQIMLNPSPNALMNIEIRFKKKPVDLSNDSDQPIVPDKWNESVMIDGALALGYNYNAVGSTSDILQMNAAMTMQFRAGIDRMRLFYRPASGKVQPVIPNYMVPVTGYPAGMVAGFPGSQG